MGDSYHLIETYYSGSRTYFSAACNKLEELGYVITPADLSDTLQNKATDWGCFYAIDVAAMEKCIPRSQRYEHHGYVLKSDIFQLEAGELEAVYEWLNGMVQIFSLTVGARSVAEGQLGVLILAGA